MPRRQKSPEASPFEQCEVKVIAFTDYVFSEVDVVATKDGSFIFPTKGIGTAAKERVEPDNPDGTSLKRYAGSGAVLRCPRTERGTDVRTPATNHDSREGAFLKLAQIANVVLCATCRYANMTEAEVASDRAEVARCETAQLQEALARDQALRELQTNTGEPYLGILGKQSDAP